MDPKTFLQQYSSESPVETPPSAASEEPSSPSEPFVQRFEELIHARNVPSKDEIFELLWAILRVQGSRAAQFARLEASQQLKRSTLTADASREIRQFMQGLRLYYEMTGGKKRLSVLDDREVERSPRGRMINHFARTGS